MKYWRVEAYDIEKDSSVVFYMLAPQAYKVPLLRKTLRSVHPEYGKIKLKACRRPDDCMLFMEEKKKPKKKIHVEPEQPERKIGFG